ncbi:hypothetical protein RHMOL_Rhmol05G0298200 [Rhododendron molle]|uniref:Uncharacterized protein n=1 Tax=Rhododendron molle TaxID=49168 RepID=A0ACC0NW07_RHOML|nr:hypothetical protein RHMOL_Rhmol05G0298200 [Rhododendron molle]
MIESRGELFVTSKLWCSDVHPHRVLPALQDTLQKLGLEYLDLYLIHHPVSMKPAGSFVLPFNKSDLLPMDFKSVWEAMEECHKLGLTKNIGVSNFSVKKLQQLLLTAKIHPAVNQVSVFIYLFIYLLLLQATIEYNNLNCIMDLVCAFILHAILLNLLECACHYIWGFESCKVKMSPLWQQKKLRKFCEEKGIHVTAYSPLGAKGTLWGTDQVMECEILKEIAKAKGKTLAQVCLRWVYEQGVSVLVKSFNEERMRENLDIFGWKLSSEESQKIDQIPQRRAYVGLVFVSDAGPFKSVEELWDGEI